MGREVELQDALQRANERRQRRLRQRRFKERQHLARAVVRAQRVCNVEARVQLAGRRLFGVGDDGEERRVDASRHELDEERAREPQQARVEARGARVAHHRHLLAAHIDDVDRRSAIARVG